MSDSNNTKQYTHNGVTVVWQPDACIHSTRCWKGLVQVFNPKARPWINLEGADMERIKDQIKQCPSGALSYIETNQPETVQEIQTENIVEVVPNGPLLVFGNITIKHSNGDQEQKHARTALCRCGASSNKPFCDGTHRKTGFIG